MLDLSEKAKAFLAQKPAVLGVIADRTYYEHPIYGDEVPMYYIDGGKLKKSEFWDMESASDASHNNF